MTSSAVIAAHTGDGRGETCSHIASSVAKSITLDNIRNMRRSRAALDAESTAGPYPYVRSHRSCTLGMHIVTIAVVRKAPIGLPFWTGNTYTLL
jgi:hypothetical protein